MGMSLGADRAELPDQVEEAERIAIAFDSWIHTGQREMIAHQFPIIVGSTPEFFFKPSLKIGRSQHLSDAIGNNRKVAECADFIHRNNIVTLSDTGSPRALPLQAVTVAAKIREGCDIVVGLPSLDIMIAERSNDRKSFNIDG